MFPHCLVATLVGCGRMLRGAVSILSSFTPFGGSWGYLSHPHLPQAQSHTLDGAVLRPKLSLFLVFSAGEQLPPPLRLSLWWEWQCAGWGRGEWRGNIGER